MIIINNKTRLRKEIKRRAGTVGELDNIWFDKDGDWTICSAGTICPNEMKVSVRRVISYRQYGYTLDKAITEAFLDIQIDLEKYFDTYSTES